MKAEKLRFVFLSMHRTGVTDKETKRDKKRDRERQSKTDSEREIDKKKESGKYTKR